MQRIAIAAALGAVLVAAGCGGGETEFAADAPRHVAPEPAPHCEAGALLPLGGGRTSFVAVARRPTQAFSEPGRRVLASFAVKNVNGHATVFAVLGGVVARDCSPRWYRVELPIRPNGVTGYIRAGDVDVGEVHTRIVVDLSERLVTLFRAGRRVMTIRGAIGSPATPTPAGRFYVNQRVLALDPEGPYGPGAIGISAYSDVGQDWAQGGPIAIHGTNRPSTIGRAASRGCVRIRNDLLKRLFWQVPAGTPVLIRA